MTTHISSRTPDALLPIQRLDVYVAARDLARRVHLAGIRDAELRDQATRAAKSAFLCLAEGLPNDGPAMRRKYFTEANNSLHETLLSSLEKEPTHGRPRVRRARKPHPLQAK